jgi:hypothetical protein
MPHELFRARVGSLVRGLSGRNKALTGAERSEVEAMVQMVMADYLALDKTKRPIAEIDRAEALVDEEWGKEQVSNAISAEGTRVGISGAVHDRLVRLTVGTPNQNVETSSN